MFETINGKLTSIHRKNVYLWPSDGFCKAGYETWAPIDRTVFLDTMGPWKALCSDISSLGGQELDKKDIYAQIVFPIFHLLTSKEREEHLRYIKDNMYQDLVHESKYGNKKRRSAASNFLFVLQTLKCLKSKNGALCSIKNFSDHTVPIFTTFPNHFEFVPEEYMDPDEWLEFLHGLGLRVTVTCEEFKMFCKLVSNGQHTDLVKASKALVSYLFSKYLFLKSAQEEWYNNDSYLDEIGNINFVQVDALN